MALAKSQSHKRMNTKTLRELKSIALCKGLCGYCNLNKADLVALLEKSSEEMPAPPPHGNVSAWIREISDHLKTLEMCNKAVPGFSCTLKYVPDELKTQDMCSQFVSSNNLYMLRHVPDQLKTQRNVL